MLDFSVIQNSSENPTAMSILLTVLFSFALSSLVVLTYDLTTRSINRPLYFLQSLALISIVAATVMQAVGDSLARGLGMLGALAIIRFRTSLKNPRNITFMFSSLAVGIACGVKGFEIAIIGTVAFCLIAILLRFSPFHDSRQLTGNLRFKIERDKVNKQFVEKIIKKHTKDFLLTLYQYDTKKEVKEVAPPPPPPPTAEAGEGLQTPVNQIAQIVNRVNIIEFRYQIKLNKVEQGTELMEELVNIEGISNQKLIFEEATFEL